MIILSLFLYVFSKNLNLINKNHKSQTISSKLLTIHKIFVKIKCRKKNIIWTISSVGRATDS